MKRLCTSLALLGLMALWLPLVAQWDSVSPDQLQMQQYAAFPDAHALVLLDQGEMRVAQSGYGFDLVLTRYVRIHVLDERAVADVAELRLPYYHLWGEEGIQDLKAQVHQLENGEMKSQLVQAEHIFDEEVDGEWAEMLITFPNVKAGSIIEYEYKQVYDEYFLNRWYFQDKWPTLLSTFSFSSVDRFGFAFLYQGNFHEHLKKTGETSWTMENVPGFSQEPYISNINDYRSKMLVQLHSTRNEWGKQRALLGTWEEFTETVLEDSDLIHRLHKGRKFARPLVKSLIAGIADQEARIAVLYNHIRDHMEWTGVRSLFPARSLKEIYRSRRGHSGEINLLLCLFLATADIPVHPMLLSTIDHGQIIKEYPIASQFNTLLALVELDSGDFVLDAIHKYRPYDLPDKADLNGEGWVLDPDQSRWFTIPDTYHLDQRIQGGIRVLPDGNMKGNFHMKADGYLAFAYRTRIAEIGQADFMASIEKDALVEGEIVSFIIDHADEPEKELDIKFEIVSSDFAQLSDPYLYLDATLWFGPKNNPFQAVERMYPIDYGHRSSVSYLLNFQIPEGYLIESLPANTRVALPNETAVFEHFCEANGPFIQVQSQLVMRQRRYPARNYAALKELTDRALLSQREPIVLKKDTP